VCVIDPDPQSREALRALLTGIGAEVRSYAAAEPFLETLPGGLPVCLISEVRLPGISGLMLLRQLKSARMSVPTILVATRPEVPLAVEAIREGAIDFIEKPLVDTRITRRVSALLSL
jgi:FixJ family two-component response regulator